MGTGGGIMTADKGSAKSSAEFWVRPPSNSAFAGACATEPTLGGIHVIEKSAYDAVVKGRDQLRLDKLRLEHENAALNRRLFFARETMAKSLAHVYEAACRASGIDSEVLKLYREWRDAEHMIEQQQ